VKIFRHGILTVLCDVEKSVLFLMQSCWWFRQVLGFFSRWATISVINSLMFSSNSLKMFKLAFFSLFDNIHNDSVYCVECTLRTCHFILFSHWYHCMCHWINYILVFTLMTSHCMSCMYTRWWNYTAQIRDVKEWVNQRIVLIYFL
jgi:hypothetical protein